MKIGTLVAQKGIKLNKREIRFVENEIKSGMQSAFGSDVTYDIEVTVADSKTMYWHISNISTLDNLVRRCYCNHRKHQYKDGDRFVPKKIMLSLSHDKCYDQAEVGPFYTWEKGFKPELNKKDYQMNLTFYGDRKDYHCREWDHNCGLIWDFEYGTELEDLAVADFFNGIKNLMKGSLAIRVRKAA